MKYVNIGLYKRCVYFQENIVYDPVGAAEFREAFMTQSNKTFPFLKAQWCYKQIHIIIPQRLSSAL